MTVRKCSTCKHYEPAPIWRKGWCRNPLLFSPQQSHLVGEDDLDCDRGMGNYWESAEDEGVAHPVTTQFDTRNDTVESEMNGTQSTQSLEVPFEMSGQEPETGTGSREAQGGAVNQFGGSRRPGDPGGTGGGGGNYDDDRMPPYDQDRNADSGIGGQPFSYESEERYWTDYLRIAIPVIGVILLLGLVWFWLASLLGDDNGDVADNGTDDSEVVIESPTAEEEDSEPTESAVTPEGEGTDEGTGEGTAEDDATNGGEEGDTPPGEIGPGATVVVANTGGDGVNMRAAPSADGELVNTYADGTEFSVTGESVAADGFTWWPVETDSVAGYIVGEYLQVAE